MPVESVSAPARSDQWGIRPEIVAALLLIAYLASTVGHIFNGNFSTGFDELANVSFIAQIQQCRCFPALNELRLLGPVTRKFTSAPSYLNHPASNYAALSIGLDITTSLRAFRLVNVLLTGGAMVLLFATLFRVVAEPLARIVDVVLVGTVPPMGQLAATVSNDNLAMLGGTLAMLGEARYLGRKTAGNLAILCGGVLVASLAKLSGLLLCGVFLAVLLLEAKSRPRHLTVAAAALAVAALPSALLTLRYGSPAPHTAGQKLMLVDGAGRGVGHATAAGASRLFLLFLSIDARGLVAAIWQPDRPSARRLAPAAHYFCACRAVQMARPFVPGGATCRGGDVRGPHHLQLSTAHRDRVDARRLSALLFSDAEPFAFGICPGPAEIAEDALISRDRRAVCLRLIALKPPWKGRLTLDRKPPRKDRALASCGGGG